MDNHKPPAEPLRTNAQKQAQDAFDRVNTLVDDPLRQAYRSLARRVPALIRDCGLMQTLAFLHSKGNERQKTEETKKTGAKQQKKPPNEFDKYLQHLEELANIKEETVRKSNLSDYLHYSRRGLTSAGWLKRYAEALISDEE